MAKASKDQTPAIVWFRRDLRLADNEALRAAIDSGRPVLPVFILEDDPPVRGPGAAGLWWLEGSLRALADKLEAIGSRLILRRGDAPHILQALVKQTSAGLVAWNRGYEPGLDARDDALAQSLKALGADVCACDGKLLMPPSSVRTKAGAAYGVFTPFWRTAQAQVPALQPQAAPKTLSPPADWPDTDRLADWKLRPTRLEWAKGFAAWTPGEEGAWRSLQDFLAHKLATYPQDRDRPALDGSSRLSPHLTWGEVTPGQLYCEVQMRLAADGLETQAQKFLSELGWREFDYGLLAQQPELEKRPFKHSLDGLKWRRNDAELDAWRKGQTGYPIVDAGMRQLWTLGWMHNRVRLIASSFLVKHLLIDWREGEAWFWDCLVDADPANNPANWQWIAGVGADAQPFFRIFNPMTQGQKFDPDGAYVRRWVPELAKADRRWIHAPWTASTEALSAAGVELGRDYPRPIIDHEAARGRALEALSAARQPAA